MLQKKRLLGSIKGISLVELMVAIAIVAVLAGLGFSVLQRSKKGADAAVCASQLRQIGMTMYLYAQDNNQLFPGPTTGNQGASYTRNGNTIGAYLRPYLNLPEAGVNETLAAKELECAAARRSIVAQGGNLKQAVYYNLPTTTIDGLKLRPLGYVASGATPTPPLSLTYLGSQGFLSRVVVLTDSDQALVSSQGGNSNVAKEPVHGAIRNALYTDGHVAGLPTKP